MNRTNDSHAHSGHRSRMRQRVQNEGFESMEPHEIIEFLLFYAIPRQDVNTLAHRLIDRFGSVRDVLCAQLPELEAVPGIGARAARWLALVGEAALSCEKLSAVDRPSLDTCVLATRYAAQISHEMTPPCCVQLCLDPARRLLFRRQICPSLSWGEPIALREAIGDMFASQASCSILLLFTGGQEPVPQSYDEIHAADYAVALRTAGCWLQDVIFVGDEIINSMQQTGQLSGEFDTETARAFREDYLRGMPAGALRVRDLRDAE